MDHAVCHTERPRAQSSAPLSPKARADHHHASTPPWLVLLRKILPPALYLAASLGSRLSALGSPVRLLLDLEASHQRLAGGLGRR